MSSTHAGADVTGLPEGDWVRCEAPRVGPLEERDAPLLARIVFAAVRRREKSNRVYNVFRTMARLGTIMPTWAVFLSQVLGRGRLPTREKELVVLRVAWRLGCIYEYGHHHHIAVCELNLPGAEIEAATTEGAAAADTRLGAFMTFTDELIADRVASDATWERARRWASEDELLELCVFVGHYVMMAGVLNTAGVQLEAPFSVPAKPRAGTS